MHYYKKNIGDYAKKTGRLSMLQHGAYTLLIDACYDRERFPTMDEAIEWTWAATAQEIEAVQFVLRKFFVLEDGVYVQSRIREEIEAYYQLGETNKRIAAEREAKRKQLRMERERSVNEACESVNEAPPNHKPINHKPINQEPKKRQSASYDAIPDLVAAGVDRQKAMDWLAVRKAKRAAETKTAIAGVLKNIAAFGISADEGIQICCERGWAGFEGGWLNARASPVKPVSTSSNAAVMERWLAKKTQEVA